MEGDTEFGSSRKRPGTTLRRAMSEAMKEFYKAKAERVQEQMDRLVQAYTVTETDHEFSETAYAILCEYLKVEE
jgi:hypothetical protein